MSDYAVRLRNFEGDFRGHIERLQAAVGFIGGASPNAVDVQAALMGSVAGINRAVTQLDALSRGVDRTAAAYVRAEGIDPNVPSARPLSRPGSPFHVPWGDLMDAAQLAKDVLGYPNNVRELSPRPGPYWRQRLRKKLKKLGRTPLVRKVGKRVAPFAAALVLAKGLLEDRYKNTTIGKAVKALGGVADDTLPVARRFGKEVRKAAVAKLRQARAARRALEGVPGVARTGRVVRVISNTATGPVADMVFLPMTFYDIKHTHGKERVVNIVDASGATLSIAGAGMVAVGIAGGPIVLGAGVVIGVGVVTYKYGPAVWHAGGRAAHWAGDQIEDAGAAVRRRAEHAKDDVADKISDAAAAAERVHDKVSDTKDAVEDAVKHKAKDVAKKAKDHTIDAAGGLVKKGWKKLW